MICEYHRNSDILLDELERLGLNYVLIDSDEEEATRLSNSDYQVINGDSEQAETPERAMIDDADLAITDAGDRNASIILTALDLNEELRLVSLTESSKQTRALAEIGVDTVISPHTLIGRRLAHKATAAVTVPEGTSVGEDVEIRELIVRHGGPFHGVEVRETPFFEHPHLTLVAGWFDGDLRLPPAPTD